MNSSRTICVLALLSILGSCAQVDAQNSKRQAQIDQIKSMLPMLDASISKDPSRPEAYYIRASSRSVTGDLAGAEADFATAESLHYSANQFDFNAHRGANYMLMKKYDLALAQFNKALAIRPNSVPCLINKASAEYELGQYRQALADSFKTLQQGRQSAAATFVVGSCYMKSGQYKYALEYLNKSIALMPGNFEAVHNRGLVYEKMGKANLAAADLARAKAMGYEPGKPWAEEL
ncbi:MAG: tetratricopeptide repeat protein [Cyanobacteria bacterium SZAS LIN-3]|nr:tetratricopeptide repeat protein [Cyanobacteria bacterium SZAS LIN-3]